MVFTVLIVAPLSRGTRNRFDAPGFLLAGIGFAGLMYALSEGPAQGWGAPQIVATLLVGVVLLAAFVPVELRRSAPMLDVRLLSIRMFRAANVITVLSAGGFLGALFVYPLMLQTALGYSALHAGLLTFPEAVGILIGTQVASRLYRPVGPRRLIAGGQALVCLMLVLIALLTTARTPALVSAGLMMALGFGQSHTFMPIQAAAFDTVPRARVGAGTAIYNAMRQAGSALGVALAATVIAAVGVGAGESGAFAAVPLGVADVRGLAVARRGPGPDHGARR